MKHLIVTLLLLGCTAHAALEPYCDRNETVRTVKQVPKTRTIVIRPSKLQFWKKSVTKTESYLAEEVELSYKVISACCEGFHMSSLRLCEPTCGHGCPAFASCVEPNRCKCQEGYISSVSGADGRPFCEPICEEACTQHAVCVSPNKCACQEPYEEVDSVCQALTGDATISADTASTGDYTTDYTAPPTTSTTTETSSDSIECAAGYQLYKGICRADFFPSSGGDEATNVTHCGLKPCGLHQICSENGNCSCEEGYAPDPQQPNAVSLVCAREDPEAVDRAGESKSFGSAAWWLIAVLAIGIAAFLAVLTVIVIRRQKGKLNVEADTKANLTCEYSNRSYNSNEWVP